MIRHGAALLRAFAGAEVPRVTVVLRKAFGGGFITMNSQALGADLVLAWPDAEIGVMAPRQAVGLVHRRELAAPRTPASSAPAAAPTPRAHHRPRSRRADGDVDEIVEPGGDARAPGLGADRAGRSARMSSATSRVGDSFSRRAPSARRALVHRPAWPPGCRGWRYRNLAAAGVPQRRRASSASSPCAGPGAARSGHGGLRRQRRHPLRPARQIDGFAASFERPAPRRCGAAGPRVVTATYPESAACCRCGRTRERMRDGPEVSTRPSATLSRRHGARLPGLAGHSGSRDRGNFAPDGFHPSDAGHRSGGRGVLAEAASARHTEQWFESSTQTTVAVMRGRTITEADVVPFAALTGDMHPQHTDRHWAADGPFGERIAHGMLVLSYALGADAARPRAHRGAARHRASRCSSGRWPSATRSRRRGGARPSTSSIPATAW